MADEKAVATAVAEGAAPSAEYVAEVTSAALGDVTPSLATQKASSQPQRPEHIPEQFWDADKGAPRVDDLAKSYAELRAKMDGGKAKEEAPPAKADEAKPDGVKIERPDPNKAAEVSPLTATVTEVAKAYAETGEVSEDQIKAVEALGMPREMIDTYLAGVKALEAQMVSEVYRAAGGEEAFASAQTWASTGLTDDELAYYNANIDNPASRIQTVEWLMAKHAAARPGEGALVEGRPSAIAGDVFETQDQVTRAMEDPRYAIDPSYRKTVAEKLLRSRTAGSLDPQAQYYAKRR